MANRQLVDYVLSLQHTNFTQAQIRQTLLEVGWSDKEVDAAFMQAQKETVVPARSDIRPAAAVMVGILLLILALSPLLGTISSPTGNVIGATSERQVPVLSEAAPSTEVLVLEEVEQNTLPPTIESTPPVPEAPPTPSTAPTQVSTPAPAVQATSAECGQLAGNARDTCFAQEALAKEDIRVCSRIRDLSTLTNCVTALAIQQNQPTLCDSLIFQDECRTAFARETNDKSACLSITQPQKRDACQNA